MNLTTNLSSSSFIELEAQQRICSITDEITGLRIDVQNLSYTILLLCIIVTILYLIQTGGFERIKEWMKSKKENEKNE